MLDGVHEIAATMQFLHGVLCLLEVAPGYRVLAAECRLVDLRIGWAGRDAAEIDRLHTESVARAEHGPHIIQAPHIVENNDERQLLGLLELLQG